MVEPVGEIEIELAINDYEFAAGAKRAGDATQKLDEKAKKLNKDLKETKTAASSAGDGFDDLGKNADKAGGRLQSLNKELQGVKHGLGAIGLGGIGKFFAGGAIGAGLLGVAGAIGEASAANNSAMSQFGIASGGNAAMFRAMDTLYRQINPKSTITPQSAASIASQITRQFGWMPESDRTALGAQIAALGEAGEDASSLLSSLNKIARSQGMQYGYGEYNMQQLLGKLGYTATQSGASVSETAAGLVAISQASEGKGIKLSDMMQMLIAGNQLYGDNTPETVGRVMAGLVAADEKTNFMNEDLRRRYPAVKDQIMQTQFRRFWPQPLQSVDVAAGMYPTPNLQAKHEADVFTKSFWAGAGDAWNTIVGGILTGPHNAPYGAFQKNVRPGINEARQQQTNITVNVAASTSPSVEVSQARHREAVLNAQR